MPGLGRARVRPKRPARRRGSPAARRWPPAAGVLTAAAAGSVAAGASPAGAPPARASSTASVSTGAVTGAVTPAAAVPIYLNTRYSFAERAAALVSRMTLAEQVAQLHTNSAPATPRLAVQQYTYW